jgi:hypothetical protein
LQRPPSGPRSARGQLPADPHSAGARMWGPEIPPKYGAVSGPQDPDWCVRMGQIPPVGRIPTVRPCPILHQSRMPGSAGSKSRDPGSESGCLVGNKCRREPPALPRCAASICPFVRPSSLRARHGLPPDRSRGLPSFREECSRISLSANPPRPCILY